MSQTVPVDIDHPSQAILLGIRVPKIEPAVGKGLLSKGNLGEKAHGVSGSVRLQGDHAAIKIVEGVVVAGFNATLE